MRARHDRAMTFALPRGARVAGRCAASLRDKRGVSAVEFAMLLPLMVTLYLGGVEVSQAIAVDRKVTLIARTLGDLVAQATSVTQRDMTNILNAATRGDGAVSRRQLSRSTVSSVEIDANGIAKVAWSDTKNGTARRSARPVTLPRRSTPRTLR